MKKILKTVVSVFALIVGSIALIAPASAESTTLTFTVKLTTDAEDAGMALSAHSSGTVSESTKLDYGTTGVNIGLLAPNIENDNVLQLYDLAPYYADLATELAEDARSVTCTSTSECTVALEVTIADDIGIAFTRPGGAGFEYGDEDGNWITMAVANYTSDATITILTREEEYVFDGEAYLLWACGDDLEGTCYHLFSALDDEYQYFSASSVADEGNFGADFDLFEEPDGYELGDLRGWVVPYSLWAWLLDYGAQTGVYDPTDATESAEWNDKTVDELITDLSIEDINVRDILKGTDMSEYEIEAVSADVCSYPTDWSDDDAREAFESCIDDYVEDNGLPRYNSVGLQDLVDSSDNAYLTHGDNMFKAVIYSDDYAALELTNFDDLEFIPYGFGDEPLELNGSTASAPTLLEMPLQDSSITISGLVYEGESINDFEITEVSALDVPEAAVTIADNGNGTFGITWHSNFFDSVVFALTGSNGETYYVKIARTTLSWFNLDSPSEYNNNFRGIRTELFYDENDTYADYEVVATIVYTDGSEEEVELTDLNWVDSNYGGNLVRDAEYAGEDSGVGLKRANFGYAFDDEYYYETIDIVYVNVKKSGSTSTNYEGTHAGSGRGIAYDVYNEDEE